MTMEVPFIEWPTFLYSNSQWQPTFQAISSCTVTALSWTCVSLAIPLYSSIQTFYSPQSVKVKLLLLNKPLRLKSFGFAPNKHVITYFHSLFQYRIFCVLHTEEYSIVSFKENILYSRHRIFCVLHIEYFVSHTHHLCYFFCQHFYAELHHSWCHFGGLKEQIRFFAWNYIFLKCWSIISND